MKNQNDSPSHRILVIDDNSAIHEDFRKILLKKDVPHDSLHEMESALFGLTPQTMIKTSFEIDCASQGREGLALVEQAHAAGRPYALAFVDGRMPPGWDGIETIRHLLQVCPNLQVVLCTAYADYSWEEIRNVLGENDSLLILKKPFENIEVLQMAHALTRKWDLNREVQSHIKNLDKAVQQQTQEKEHTRALLETALDHSPSGIIITDARDASIIWINSTALDFCNDTNMFSKGNKIGNRGEDWQILRHDETQFSYEELPILRTTGKGEIIHNEEIIIRYSPGMDRWISSNAAPVHDSSGAIIAGIFLFQDITERKRAESEHERLLAELHQAQKMESIGVLAGGIAHDFNNLLQVANGNIELLLLKHEQDVSLTAHLTTVAEALDRASQLTRQLLIFSRKVEIQRREINPNREVKEVLKIIKRTIPKMISVELLLDDVAWTIIADPVQFGQVMLNLCSNAAEAMEEGGRLVIETSNLVLDNSITHTYPDVVPGRYLLMSVSDTGIGMDQNILDHIFEPFFTTKEVGKGTGLGLATVYGIIKEHGGNITCQSKPGQGTTFKIYWPVKQESDLTANSCKPDQAAPRQGSETILIVDDEAYIRDLYTEVLESHGYKVYSAANGKDALSVYAEKGETIDMTILDLNMPGIGGKQCLQELVMMNPSARVLIASGYDAECQIEEFMQSGNVDLLSKPCKINDLLIKVRSFLDLPYKFGDVT
ncbi:MAG: response regulator [Smithella sp.]